MTGWSQLGITVKLAKIRGEEGGGLVGVRRVGDNRKKSGNCSVSPYLRWIRLARVSVLHGKFFGNTRSQNKSAPPVEIFGRRCRNSVKLINCRKVQKLFRNFCGIAAAGTKKYGTTSGNYGTRICLVFRSRDIFLENVLPCTSGTHA